MERPVELIKITKEVWGTNTELHKAMDEGNWTEVLRCLPPANTNDTHSKVSVGADWALFALENNLVELPKDVEEKLITQIEPLLSRSE
ncbi:hypothetical protein [Desulfobacula toluolica]|uniref:Uncharacterized protein n=1 Tax=Desulfobacula toluolica (strain DSM 7467 / Tol2) TaxID=651182 RepID=K0NPG6_DESTT|nr:hypothetical protein [Desulfobacula toluolica]CCK80742.1 uncharacterized protein TOL2_C25830 [Desulfobacula toluolica Tol2]